MTHHNNITYLLEMEKGYHIIHYLYDNRITYFYKVYNKNIQRIQKRKKYIKNCLALALS